MQVTPGTYDSMHLILNKLGISEIRRLKGMTMEIGSKEITQLLELSLSSKSPLTDMFLRKEKSHVPAPFLSPKPKPVENESNGALSNLPLGTVVELFGAASSLICIDNLYTSVKKFDVGRILKSDFHKSTLISPKLPPTYKCKNLILDVQEMNAELYYHYKHVSYDCPKGLEGKLLSQKEYGQCTCSCFIKLKPVWLDPKAPANETVGTCGYAKEPTNFMVTDDLTVTPLSPLSTIGLLNNLGVDLSALAQREISVGREEALCLLKASLISTSALTTAFSPSFNFREPKQETFMKLGP